MPLDLTDRTKLATLVESATGTKFVSRFGTGGPRPQRTGAVCSAPQEASFGIFGTAACTLRSLPHVCGWLALSAALLLHARAYAVHTCRGLHQLDGRVVALDELTPTRASTPPPPTVSKLRAWRCRCVYLYNFLLVVHTTDSLSFRHLQVKCAALESALEVEERISAQQEEGGAAEAAARIAAEARVTSLCRCVLYR